MKGLTDIPGILVGHASDYEGLTGCTVVLCETGAVAGADVRGGATGTEELAVTDAGHVTPVVHAVVLAGGSAFGLEAASGVRRYLEQKGIGYDTRAAKVPIVPAAILYDLGIGKASARPTREMGEAAAAAASDKAVAEGCVGAGTGATVGKARGITHAMKGGAGTATIELGGRHQGVLVSALVAVNAFGDVRDPRSSKIVVGARRSPDAEEFLDSEQWLIGGGEPLPAAAPWNTTLAVVATNARLSKPQAQRLAQSGSVGMARSLWPCHTTVDGDVVFALSIGDRTADMQALCSAAAQAVSEAIVRAVTQAHTLGGVPGLKK
jgi:L-aminopeptidase/D-esterase-like protein